MVERLYPYNDPVIREVQPYPAPSAEAAPRLDFGQFGQVRCRVKYDAAVKILTGAACYAAFRRRRGNAAIPPFVAAPRLGFAPLPELFARAAAIRVKRYLVP